jgi:hypothetical protein
VGFDWIATSRFERRMDGHDYAVTAKSWSKIPGRSAALQRTPNMRQMRPIPGPTLEGIGPYKHVETRYTAHLSGHAM